MSERSGWPGFIRLFLLSFQPGPCRIQSRTGRGLLKFLARARRKWEGDFLRAGESVIVFRSARVLCFPPGARVGSHASAPMPAAGVRFALKRAQILRMLAIMSAAVSISVVAHRLQASDRNIHSNHLSGNSAFTSTERSE